MSEFKINDFGLFSESSNAINNSISNINSSIDECQNTMQQMCTEDTFSGPIAESCLNGWNTISSAIKAPTNALSKSSMYLNIVNNAYIDSDNKNASDISNV